jgi:hypothetical protein
MATEEKQPGLVLFCAKNSDRIVIIFLIEPHGAGIGLSVQRRIV